MKNYPLRKQYTLTVAYIACLLLTSITNADSSSISHINKSSQDKQGIQILSVRTTAAGYMLDFRYKIIDSEKAATFLAKKNKPQMKVLKNGIKLLVPSTPKIGPLRQSSLKPKAGKNYFMFFANPGKMVKAGDKVQFTISDFKSRILTVE